MTGHSTAARLTPLQWLICAVAALGFAFDTYELLMLPLIVRPALPELLGAPLEQPEVVNAWVGTMQYYPAVAGGIFGLLGGYLTDRLGTPARARLQHPALRLLGAGRRVRDDGRMAAVLALLHVRRRLRRVRGGGGLAVGAVHRSGAARECARLHAGVRLDRRPDGDRRLLLLSSRTDTAARRFTAGTKRGATR